MHEVDKLITTTDEKILVSVVMKLTGGAANPHVIRAQIARVLERHGVAGAQSHMVVVNAFNEPLQFTEAPDPEYFGRKRERKAPQSGVENTIHCPTTPDSDPV